MMKTKKLLLTVAVGLVVIGCIIAAGCTSTSQSSSSNLEEQIVGIWIDGGNTFCYVMDSNKTGVYYKQENGTLIDANSVMWRKNDDGTYVIIKGEEKTIVTLDPVKGQFTTSSGSIFEKQAENTSGYMSWEHYKKDLDKYPAQYTIPSM